MKKYLLAAVAIVASYFLQAQDLVITGTKQISKKLTPQQVLDSLNKKFPDAKSVQYYEAPASGVRNGWAITEEDNLSESDDVDYYTISFKRDKVQYYGLYDKEGNLLQSKMQEDVDKLPEPIKASLMELSKEYPGYKMVSKTYYKKQNYSKSNEYYEIVAEKGKDKKIIYYSPDGKIVKTKG